jgi:hypothetical protein
MSRYVKRMLVSTWLCVPLIALPAWGQVDSPPARPNKGGDGRLGIVTLPKERTLILNNMRQYLVGLQTLTEAVADNDLPKSIEAARSMGSINLYELRLMFANDASIRFHQILFDVHRNFDEAATEAEEKKDTKVLLKRVSVIMKKCTYCHETFQLLDTAH